MSRDTIFALASGRPPAGIAIVRISGPAAHAAAKRIAGELPLPRRAALRQFRYPGGGDLIDEGLVLRFDAPASSTAEDLVEFHCHGGRAVVDALLAALASVEGLRCAEPGEFTRRAFENGRIDLTQAEGLADLIEAETESQRRAALALAEGGLRQQIEQWQQQLLELSARAEGAIDYVDEDELGSDPGLSRECDALASELERWLQRPRIEPLKDGVRTVVAGPPNAGKSSLINAIAGSERAIVTEVPGTTRDYIEVPLAVDGIPLLLTDTAGLRETQDPVERIGVERSLGLVGGADILLWLGKPEQAPDHPRRVLIHPKTDLAGREMPPEGSLAVSSVTGAGLKQLLAEVAALARSVIPAEDALALNRRQAGLIAEAHRMLRAAAAVQEVVLVAENLRAARLAFDRLTGRAGVEDVLDALFGRFCLGK